jgi:hypothetical protein
MPFQVGDYIVDNGGPQYICLPGTLVAVLFHPADALVGSLSGTERVGINDAGAQGVTTTQTIANLAAPGNTGPPGLAGPGISSSAPATATSVGQAATVAYDATHIYVCVATNTWVRATLAAW